MLSWADVLFSASVAFVFLCSPTLIRSLTLFAPRMPLVTHISDLRLKKPFCSVLKSSKTCACGPVVVRMVFKPTTPRSSNTNAQMDRLMIFILTGCQYIFYYLKVWDWNWEFRVACFLISYQSCFFQTKVQTWCLTLSLYMFISSEANLECMGPWTDMFKGCKSVSSSWQPPDFNILWHLH